MPFVLGIVLAFAALVLALLGGIAVAVLKVLKGPRVGREDDGGDDQEARVIQEIHQGLTRMEQRIEALETILLERQEDKEQAR